MNYRHIYHAGNFADVIKHITITVIIEKLKLKEKNFTVLDAFAGVGMYDLQSEESLNTSEFNFGIKKFIKLKFQDEYIKKYLNIVNRYLTHDFYPGSPLISFLLKRQDDIVILSEKNEKEFAELRRNIKTLPQNNLNTHLTDGYNAIKAFTPFKTSRGLVIIDPPFEARDEFDKIIDSLATLSKRCNSVPVLIWFPIKEKHVLQKFYTDYKNLGFKEAILIEHENDFISKGLKKCGLLIINPPNILDIMQNISSEISKLWYDNYKEKIVFDINKI